MRGQLDTVLYDKLRNSRTGRLVRSAQVAQVSLAVCPSVRPYSPPEEGERPRVHTTVPGSSSQQVLTDANGTGLFLLVVGSDSYSTFSLPQDGSVSIGRGETNQVRVDDPLASRNHARLHVGDAMYLEDLGSVNGTRVKEQPVPPGDRVPIALGDTILIGKSVLIIQQRARKRPPLLRPETLRDDRGVASVIAPQTEDQAMKRLHQLAERAAAGTINVIVTGETGVGKELLSETVHRLSPRRDGPYVCLNCASLSETLLESELFGHERGAFTGAFQAKAGLLETAAGGSLFLDEVGELSLTTQAKLLRVLETREVSRLGSLKPRRIDVRFIAATNRDLEAEVARGAFRRDLYFRLNGITLTIPPLRERRGEIPHLAATFIGRICRELGRPEPQLPPPILAFLEQYAWPGNIRELKNLIERAVLLCDGPAIGLDHLPAEKLDPSRAPKPTPSPQQPLAAAAAARARNPTQQNERLRIIEALNACAGNQSRAAQHLGISRRTLVTKLDVYRIPRPKKSVED